MITLCVFDKHFMGTQATTSKKWEKPSTPNDKRLRRQIQFRHVLYVLFYVFYIERGDKCCFCKQDASRLMRGTDPIGDYVRFSDTA